jgi:hypothetical protein
LSIWALTGAEMFRKNNLIKISTSMILFIIGIVLLRTTEGGTAVGVDVGIAIFELGVIVINLKSKILTENQGFIFYF